MTDVRNRLMCSGLRNRSRLEYIEASLRRCRRMGRRIWLYMVMYPEVRPGKDDWGTDLTVWEACVVDGAGGNLRMVVCLHGSLSVERRCQARMVRNGDWLSGFNFLRVRIDRNGFTPMMIPPQADLDHWRRIRIIADRLRC